MARRHSQDALRLRAMKVVMLALGVLALNQSANAEANLAVEATAGYTNNLLRLPEGVDDSPVSLGLDRHLDRIEQAPVGRRRGPGGWRHVSERQLLTTRFWASSMAR